MTPAPVLGVGAFVFDRCGRLLVVQRGRAPSAGLWSLPGGRVEFGERLRDACRREVYEETGVRVQIGPLVLWFERMSQARHYVVLDFLARPAAGLTRPRAGDDARAVRWVGPAQLRLLPTTPHLARYVRRAWTQAQATGFLDASPGTSRTSRGTR